MTIVEALISLLRGAGNTESRVFEYLMPDGNTKACIVITLVSPSTAVEGGIYRDVWQINGFCKGRNANEELGPLMAEIEGRLHRFSGIVGGLHIQRIMAQNTGGRTYEADTQWWHGFRDYAINYTTLEGR